MGIVKIRIQDVSLKKILIPYSRTMLTKSFKLIVEGLRIDLYSNKSYFQSSDCPLKLRICVGVHSMRLLLHDEQNLNNIYIFPKHANSPFSNQKSSKKAQAALRLKGRRNTEQEMRMASWQYARESCEKDSFEKNKIIERLKQKSKE